MAGKVPQTSESVFRKEGRMISAGHHSLLSRTVKYPWDYRVEYFQVATPGLYFEAGQWQRFGNWPETVPDASSDLQSGIRNGIHGWQVFAFPNAKSTDQKIVGNYGIFVAYPYSGRMNCGGFSTWMSYPDSSAAAFIETNTKTIATIDALGSSQIQLGFRQGTGSWTGTWDASGRGIVYNNHYFIFGYSEGPNGNVQTNQIYAGTKFYETGFDFDIRSGLELHLRFVPCMLGGVPYICEMNTKTMIQSSGSGSITAGPQVSDDYEAWSN